MGGEALRTSLLLCQIPGPSFRAPHQQSQVVRASSTVFQAPALRAKCALIIGALLFGWTPQSAYAGTFYVSDQGDDNNPGSKARPWKTIQKAADTIAPGDVAVIGTGVYPENVKISRSGTSDAARLRFRSEVMHKARCTSFTIKGSYVSIEGFDVEADTTSWVGIRVVGATNVEVAKCRVTNCPNGGIGARTAAHVSILDNTVRDNGQWGISVVGSHIRIEGNSVTGTVQYHKKGTEPGFKGHDADGLRVFGDHHLVRNNRILDIADPTRSENVDPHADCIQTWDGPKPNGSPVMTNTIIERNHCRVLHASGKGVMMSAIHGTPCHHITIRNNVFEFRDIGISATLGAFHDIIVQNNTFKAQLGEKSWGAAVSMANVSAYAVQNNIMVDCHPQSRKIVGGDGIVDHNLIWHSDGSAFAGSLPGKQAHELWGVDPRFVSYAAKGTNNNYALKSGSPAIDTGTALSSVNEDILGVPRPQGKGHDIGAYEGCKAATCKDLGRECGSVDDGCGVPLDCGGCSKGQRCSSAGKCVAGCVDCKDGGGSDVTLPIDGGVDDSAPRDQALGGVDAAPASSSSGGCWLGSPEHQSSPKSSLWLLEAALVLAWVRRRAV